MNTDATAYRIAARPLLVTALILTIPLVAMQFSDDVVWTSGDFIVAGFLLLATGVTYEVAARKAGSVMYRAAFGLALLSALLLVWINLAVGIIGSEDEAANVTYVAVLAVGFLGALAARFRPRGMALTLYAMAAVTAVIGVVAVSLGLGLEETGPEVILGVTGMFVTLFVGAGLLFRNAAEDESRGAGTGG